MNMQNLISINLYLISVKFCPLGSLQFPWQFASCPLCFFRLRFLIQAPSFWPPVPLPALRSRAQGPPPLPYAIFLSLWMYSITLSASATSFRAVPSLLYGSPISHTLHDSYTVG